MQPQNPSSSSVFSGLQALAIKRGLQFAWSDSAYDEARNKEMDALAVHLPNPKALADALLPISNQLAKFLHPVLREKFQETKEIQDALFERKEDLEKIVEINILRILIDYLKKREPSKREKRGSFSLRFFLAPWNQKSKPSKRNAKMIKIPHKSVINLSISS